MKTKGISHFSLREQFLIAAFLLLCSATGAQAQEKASAGPEPLTYPPAQGGVVHVEAESAVSSNFSQEPTLDYGSSGQRMLQVNQSQPQFDGSVYFAEWVFHADEAGTYRFWYGGTPPGPEDSLNPSYVSPFRYSVNGQAAVDVWREKVAVVESYSPILYWVDVAELPLEKGTNTLRIEVPQRRRYDNRYYFYMDRLLFVRKGAPMVSADPAVRGLPANPADRSINNNYRSFPEYEALIQASPRDVRRYLGIASVYSLVGDYQSALRYLLRGLLVEPGHPELTLMVAKNRIWKGEVAEGLQYFRTYLQSNPGNPEVWAEAAKIAAWNGEYDTALALYREALVIHPDNLNLKVNLGLTLLWANKSREGSELIDSVRGGLVKDSAGLFSLADIFESNGYADQAILTCETAIEHHPRLVEAWLRLSDLHLRQGNPRKASSVLGDLIALAPDDAGLALFVDTFRARQDARSLVIRSYRDRLRENPDNPELRAALVQALFWNGLKDEGLAEYEDKFMNTYFRTLMKLYRQETPLFSNLAEAYRLGEVLDLIDARVAGYRGMFAALATEEASLERTRSSLAAEGLRLDQRRKDLAQRLEAARKSEESAPEGEKRSQAAKARADLESGLGQLELDQEGNRKRNDELAAQSSNLDVRRDALAARVNEFLALATTLLGREEAIAAAQNGRAERNKAWADQLAAVRSQKGWVFDPAAWKEEFRDTRAHDSAMATAGLAFFLALEEKGAEAASLVDTLRLPDGGLPRTLAELGTVADLARGRPGSLQGRELAALADSLAALADADLPAGPGPEGARGDAAAKAAGTDPATVLSGLGRMGESTRALRPVLKERIKALWKEANGALAYYSYLFEEDNFPARIQWGEYAMGSRLLEKAVGQFRKVLAVDPSNIRVKTRLAGALEQLGNWFDAMARYREVHAADPGDLGIMARYNALERQHGAVTHADMVFGADPGKTLNLAMIGWKGSLAQGVNLAIDWTFDQNSIHRAFLPWPDPDRTQAQKLEAVLEYQPGTSWPVFIPALGVLVENELVENQYAQLPGPFLLPDTLAFQKPHLLAGLGLRGTAGPLTASAAWRYLPVAETLAGLRPLAWSHQAELQLAVYQALENSRPLSFFSSRTYGLADIRLVEKRPDPVVVGTLVQDLILGFHVLDAPWTSLNLVATGTFEQSSARDSLPFYAPDAVATAKGGPQVSSWFSLGEGKSLGLIGRLAGGAWMEGLGGSELLVLPLVEADAELNLVLGGLSFYVKGTGNATYRTAGAWAGVPEYWSGQLRFGLRNKAGDILAP